MTLNRRDATGWVTATPRRWDGLTWAAVAVARRWDGTTWVDMLAPRSGVDTFNRTAANGWGVADSGQSWVTSGGSAADYSVKGV